MWARASASKPTELMAHSVTPKPSLKTSAQRMRAKPTRGERAVANALRRAGIVFKQQKVVAGAIADFFLPCYCLVIEVDGFWHDEPGQYLRDLRRSTKIRQATGAEVLRIPNEAACRREIADSVVTLIEKKGRIWRDRLQEQVYRILLRSDLSWADEYVLRRQKLEAKYGPDETEEIRQGVGPRELPKRKRSPKKRRRAKTSSAQARRSLERARERLDPGPPPEFADLAARARQRVTEERRAAARAEPPAD